VKGVKKWKEIFLNKRKIRGVERYLVKMEGIYSGVGYLRKEEGFRKCERISR